MRRTDHGGLNSNLARSRCRTGFPRPRSPGRRGRGQSCRRRSNRCRAWRGWGPTGTPWLRRPLGSTSGTPGMATQFSGIKHNINEFRNLSLVINQETLRRAVVSDEWTDDYTSDTLFFLKEGMKCRYINVKNGCVIHLSCLWPRRWIYTT